DVRERASAGGGLGPRGGVARVLDPFVHPAETADPTVACGPGCGSARCAIASAPGLPGAAGGLHARGGVPARTGGAAAPARPSRWGPFPISSLGSARLWVSRARLLDFAGRLPDTAESTAIRGGGPPTILCDPRSIRWQAPLSSSPPRTSSWAGTRSSP